MFIIFVVDARRSASTGINVSYELGDVANKNVVEQISTIMSATAVTMFRCRCCHPVPDARSLRVSCYTPRGLGLGVGEWSTLKNRGRCSKGLNLYR